MKMITSLLFCVLIFQAATADTPPPKAANQQLGNLVDPVNPSRDIAFGATSGKTLVLDNNTYLKSRNATDLTDINFVSLLKFTGGASNGTLTLGEGSGGTISLTRTGTINVQGKSDASGTVYLTGPVEVYGTGDGTSAGGSSVLFSNNDQSDAVTLRGPNDIVGGAYDLTFYLPHADGTAGDCMKTDGSGQLGFSSCSGSSDATSLQGVAVSSTPPTDAQVLTYNNSATQWEPRALPAGISSSGISGSVQFSDGSGGLSSDASKFYWDNGNKRLGIGTGSPRRDLEMNGTEPTLLWWENDRPADGKGWQMTSSAGTWYLQALNDAEEGNTAISITKSGNTITGVQLPQGQVDIGGALNVTGTITGTLSGNASTASALASDPSDCGSNTYSTGIGANGNLTCASITNASTTATSANTASAIVARDGSGNFSASTITAALTGNASTASALQNNPSDCGADTYATTIAASGNLTCATVTNAGLAGSIAASKLVGSDIATVGTVTTGTWSATAIGATKGGTGLTSVTTGDLIYGSATDTWSKLAAGTSGKALVQGASIPSWTTLGISGGGTGATTLTNHGVLLGQATSAIAATSAGTSGQPLLSGGASADPNWGTLGIGAGGTGATTAQTAIDALLPTQTSNARKVLTTDGTNSSWTTGAVPTLVATMSQSGQTGDFGATAIYTPSSDSWYQLNCYHYISTAATSSSTVPSIRVAYTIAETSVALTATIVVATSATNATNTQTTGVRYFKAKSGVAININTQSYASSGATAMVYGFYCALYRMD